MIAVDTDERPGSREQVDRFIEALARGSVRWMEGHHDIHAQQPEAVAAELAGFAARIGSPP